MIYLSQTDTTVGLLSQNLQELNLAKKRPLNQPCLITVSSFWTLKKFVRVPNRFKNMVRRSKKTTFIYQNNISIRVVKDHKHSKFLDKIGWAYSTSANLHGEEFDLKFALLVANRVVDTEFKPQSPSKIYKISNNSIRKIR